MVRRLDIINSVTSHPKGEGGIKLWKRQTKHTVMMTMVGPTKIVNVMHIMPGIGDFVLRCGHINHIVKMHYFFEIFHFQSRAWISKTKYIILINTEGSTKIVKFIIPVQGFLC